MRIISFILSTIFLFPLFSHAQTSIPSQIPGLEEQVSIEVKPEFPKPGQKVSIIVNAYGTNLNKANITWKINGTSAKTGRGANKFETTAGKPGEQKTISLVIEPESGPIIEKTIKIRPEEVDLIWESKTYTPPFYKGKALFAPKEKVIVVAFPNFTSNGGVGVDPKKLSYTWKRNFDVVQEFSGYGNDYMNFNGTILLKDEDIQVNVESDANGKAQSYVLISPILPITRFYEKSPLYGILFNNELGTTISLSSDEKEISAYPYYFGFKTKGDSNALYEWKINGNKVDLPEDQYSVVFRNTTGEEGESVISLVLKNTSNFLQETRDSFNIQFEKRDSPDGVVSF